MGKDKKRGVGDGGTLFDTIATRVGKVDAADALRPRVPAGCCEFHDPVVEDVQCCDRCPHELTEDLPAAADSEGLDVHAALNTYEVDPEATPGVTIDEQAGQLSVVGENRRRLIARSEPDGAWIGGCKISSPADLRMVAAWLALEAARGGKCRHAES